MGCNMLLLSTGLSVFPLDVTGNDSTEESRVMQSDLSKACVLPCENKDCGRYCTKGLPEKISEDRKILRYLRFKFS